MNGEYLSHHIFADDIVLIARSTDELTLMLNDLYDRSKPAGLNMNLDDTKITCDTNANINARDVIVNGKKIKKVNDSVYLGQRVSKDHEYEQACTWHSAS